MYKDMNKPLAGFSQLLFQLWLYAPLLFLVYINVLCLVSIKGFCLLPVILPASFFIARTVIFNEEFRQFSRATPFRILVFFGIAFVVAEIFVIVLSAIQEDLRVTMGLITIPVIYAFIFTPLLVMRCEGWLPKPQENQMTGEELSEPPSAVI